jgi:hypothetical protein
VIQLSEVFQDLNSRSTKDVSHGDCAMSSDSAMRGQNRLPSEGLDQLRRIGFGQYEGKGHDGQAWFSLAAEVGQRGNVVFLVGA